MEKYTLKREVPVLEKKKTIIISNSVNSNFSVKEVNDDDEFPADSDLMISPTAYANIVKGIAMHDAKAGDILQFATEGDFVISGC